MAARWVASFLLLGGLLILLAAPPSSAQTPGDDTTETSPGFLYLTDQVTDAVPGFGPFPNPLCDATEDLRIYGITSDVPRDSRPGKAYTPGHYGPVSCIRAFTYEASEGFTITDEARATLWMGCETGAAFYSTSRVDQFSDYYVQLIHNGEQIAGYRGDYEFGLETGFCFPDGSPYRLEAPLEAGDTVVAPGDNLTLQVSIFATISLRDNIYVATESPMTPSSLYGPGFPGDLRASPRSDLVVDPGNVSSSAGPGNATTYQVTVENTGSSPRNVSASIEGPQHWYAEPSPTSFAVPAGEVVEATLTIAPPSSAARGSEAQHLVKLAAGEEGITFATTTTVVPETGTPLEGSDKFGEQEPLEAAGGSGADESSFLDEFWVELTAAGAVGAFAFVVRQFA